MLLPHVATDGGVADDDATRYIRVRVEDGVAKGPLLAYLYDLGLRAATAWRASSAPSGERAASRATDIARSGEHENGYRTQRKPIVMSVAEGSPQTRASARTNDATPKAQEPPRYGRTWPSGTLS